MEIDYYASNNKKFYISIKTTLDTKLSPVIRTR